MKISILMVLFLGILLLPKLSYSWWSPSWRYRNQVSITENSGNSLIDYPINTIVNTQSLITTGKMKPDCSDIRVINETANLELPFSVLGCNSESTVITTKVNLTTSQSADGIYLYYGNPTAVSTSISFNDAYYELWDDFTGTERDHPDASKWGEKSWYSAGGDVYLSKNTTKHDCGRDWQRPGIYSLKNFSTLEGWEVTVKGEKNFANVYGTFVLIDADDLSQADIYDTCEGYPAIYWEFDSHMTSPTVKFIKCNNFGDAITIGSYTLTYGWHTYKIIFNKYHNNVSVYFDDTYKGSTDLDVFSSTHGLSLVGMGSANSADDTYTDDFFIRAYTDPEPTIELGTEETYQPLSLTASTDKHILFNEFFPISISVNYDATPMTTLSESNFQIFLNDTPLTIHDFMNIGNGSYLLKTKTSSHSLGKHSIKIKLTYEQKSVETSLKTTLLTRPKDKILIITDKDWKNYIPAVSTRKSVLVYNTTREFIDYFISEYRPEQIFQLGETLTFNRESFSVDTPETLIKLFFKNSDLVMPSDKQTAIAASMLTLPILLDPSPETLEYINPNRTYDLNSVQEVETLYFQGNPVTNYIILTNPAEEESMFASSLAKKKNAFIVQSTGSPEQAIQFLKQKINRLKPQTSKDYLFDQTVHLALIGMPHFLVNDPVNDGKIRTDTPYADVNDDDFLDLSVGRFLGNLESVSYQIEYSTLLEPQKTALLLASYNTPGKYSDVLTAGGTMPYVFDIELELIEKGFKTARLVEKKSDFDRLDMSVLERLKNMTDLLGILSAKSYGSFFSQLLGDLSQVYLIGKAGGTILYSIYEFDWYDAWQKILSLELPENIDHLPLLNEQNLLEHVPKNRVIIYLSKGNESHWFLPLESTFKETKYLLFDPSNLPFNPSFYYLRYSRSFDNSNKVLNAGALSLITSTGDSYSGYSDRSASNFFENFDRPVGESLSRTKNRNLELYDYTIESSIFKESHSPQYKKEYYTKTLIGDPSLVFDPILGMEQSKNIQNKDGKFILTFTIRPEYSFIKYEDNTFILFKDLDDYLLVNNKPIVPLYKKLFLLPTDSEIIDYSVEYSTKTYDDISFPVLFPDPEFFENETFVGSFPEEFYWNGTIQLLDGRKELDFLFSPVIYSSNNTVTVLDGIIVSFTYDAPLDITKIYSTDMFQDETASIFFDVYNNLEKEVEVNSLASIQTKEHEKTTEKTFTLSPGMNNLRIDWTNTTQLGNYSVSLVLTYDDIVVGPKYTYFTVNKKPIIGRFLYPMIKQFSLRFTGFFKKIVSFRERTTIKKQGNTLIVDYVSWNVSLHIEQKNQTSTSKLKTKEAELLIERMPRSRKYTIRSPDGILIVLKENGEIKESGDGDSQRLERLLTEMLKIYEEELVRLNLSVP